MTAQRRTCVQCGAALRKQTLPQAVPKTQANPYGVTQVPTGRLGFRGDGYFCSERCGYTWAVQRLGQMAGQATP
jgi:hypothetical protein